MPNLVSTDPWGLTFADARPQLAALRTARGVDAPTLGWLFGDTPGVPSPDDGAMAAAAALALALEEWALR